MELALLTSWKLRRKVLRRFYRIFHGVGAGPSSSVLSKLVQVWTEMESGHWLRKEGGLLRSAT